MGYSWHYANSTKDSLSFQIVFDKPLLISQQDRLDQMEILLNIEALISDSDIRKLNLT